MPTFAWTARSADGSTRRGTEDAASETALVQRLRSGGMVTLEVKQGSGRAEGRRTRSTWQQVFRPRSEDIEVGLQQIAFMLKSGLPLTAALSTTAKQATRASMATTWTEVSEKIQSGGSFSEALSEHPCFPRVVTTMTKLGEATGILDEVMERAAESMERRRALKTSLMTALAYPAIVILMCVGVVTFMMVSLIPKLTKFLTSFHRRLPPITQLLVDISAFMQAHFVTILIVAVAAGVALVLFRRWPPGRLVTDRVILRIPIIGRIVKLTETSTFSRNMGILLGSGVRVTDALEVVQPLLINAESVVVTRDARERILQGSSLSQPLADTRPFYPMLSSMVAVGETSGTLEEVLLRVAEFHESRLQVMIKRLSTIIEPVVIVFIGGIVGFIYMAFFMAIYSIVGGR